MVHYFIIFINPVFIHADKGPNHYVYIHSYEISDMVEVLMKLLEESGQDSGVNSICMFHFIQLKYKFFMDHSEVTLHLKGVASTNCYGIEHK